MTNKQALIALEHCSVKLGEHLALHDVSFTLHAGERWVLMGANGSGKSVLLKLLRGDMWPTAMGNELRRYHLHGEWHAEPGEDKAFIAYSAPERQDKYLRYNWNLKVVQVVTTGLFDEDIPLTKPSTVQQARVVHMLKTLRLWSLRERRILTLSYGQRRRVLLARMLIGRPKVLLLDEVFNGVDATTRLQLRKLLQDAQQAPTWVLAAHSADDIPDNATHLLELQQGRVIYAGPLQAERIEQLRRDSNVRHQAARRRIQAADLKAPRPVKTKQLLALHNVDLFRDYRPVVKGVNWTVNVGEHWAIVGANGSGKSTLLMLLYGDLHPYLGGKVERTDFVQGTPISQWKARVGYVSPELQADHFAAGTIEDIVASGRYASIGLNQTLTAADRRAAKPWLKFFGIDALAARGPRQVSYGQMRLALLARAMINRPQLLLLDEPFTGLDPEMHAYVMATLEHVAASGTQIIMAVHDKADVLPAVKYILRIGRDGHVSQEIAPPHALGWR
jgi:molybdate transport system ATP-binding protein